MASRQEHRTDLVDAALRLLGIRRFALAIHDASFPSTPEEDVGRGSPYSLGGQSFLRFARALGFNAVQLGPQGQTTRDDPSPYNSSIFSKSILSLAPLALADDPRLLGVVLPDDLDRLLARWPRREVRADRVDHARAWEVARELLQIAHGRFRGLRNASADLAAAFEQFVAAQRSGPVDWFERDALHEALRQASRLDDWRRWGQSGSGRSPLDQRLYCPRPGEEAACRRRIEQLGRQHAAAIERFALGQFLLHLQHDRLRALARDQGLVLYGDMHVGCAHQDWWAWRALFLPNYLLGAPPSRTNPQGQPWGYPVLDPHQVFTRDARGEMTAGPALAFVQARVGKLLGDFDGLRIDHPQGLVCPWVYRADDPDPLHAVANGARLHSAPNYPDHPELRQYALVRPDQLNPDPDYPRYGDEQVTDLSAEQVDRYAVLLDAVIDCAKRCGRAPDDVLCEVLSTWPMPLRTVMRQRGMGRFCITQKADPRKPDDVYRPENTSPRDWIMVGSHDTKPLWLVVEENRSSGWMRDRAALLAERLAAAPDQREALVARLASDPQRFCEAMFAELFLGPARNVSVFFADLLGEKQPYNRPGTASADNWTLRVAGDYQAQYFARAARSEAMDIKRALAWALEAKAAILPPEAGPLAEQLRHASPGQPAGQ